MTLDDDELKIVPERDAVSTVRRSSNGSGGALLWVAVGMLVVALGALYYQNNQLNDLLEKQGRQFSQQKSNFDQAESRILALENKLAATGRDLESKLTATGRNLSQSGSSLEKRISESEHEIRKLWDLSNKRNKVDIASQGKLISALTAKLDNAEKKLAQEQARIGKTLAKQQTVVKEELASITQSITAQQEQQSQMLASHEEAVEQVSALNLQNQALEDQAAALKDDIAAIRSKFKGLDEQKKSLADLEKKFSQLDIQSQTDVKVLLDEHAERLDAIDASRRQLTSSVTRLTTDVNQLQLNVNKLKPVS